MSDDYINGVSERYIELFEKITGEKFVKEDLVNIENRINKNVTDYLNL
jgi:phosphoribosylaminoimidazole-succinocarboxamide synthase